MAYSYVPESVKAWANEQMNNLHATFARPITIWKTATQVIVSSNPDTSFIFAGAPGNSETLIIQNSGVFNARILYGKKQENVPFNSVQWRNSAEQNNLYLQDGEVRIRLDSSGAQFLANSEQVTFDGDIFELTTSKRPHSVLGPPQYFDFFLRKVN